MLPKQRNPHPPLRGSDYRRLFRALWRQGWCWTVAGSGHVRLRSPEGRLVISSSTPSCRNAFAALVARLVRCGFAWPTP